MKTMEFIGTPVKRAMLALTVAALVQAGSALAALELRDINGKPTTNSAAAEFAYDTVLDATWYLTANNSSSINTPFHWEDAVHWASGLKVGTFSDWTLPSTDPACAGNIHFGCASQMGELYHTALGNTFGSTLYQTNIGPFKNLVPSYYWSGTEYAPAPNSAWAFDFSYGGQNGGAKGYDLNALAIRPGDVAAVPEPGMGALLLSGLAGVLVMRRRRPVRS